MQTVFDLIFSEVLNHVKLITNASVNAQEKMVCIYL